MHKEKIFRKINWDAQPLVIKYHWTFLLNQEEINLYGIMVPLRDGYEVPGVSNL